MFFIGITLKHFSLPLMQQLNKLQCLVSSFQAGHIFASKAGAHLSHLLVLVTDTAVK